MKPTKKQLATKCKLDNGMFNGCSTHDVVMDTFNVMTVVYAERDKPHHYAVRIEKCGQWSSRGYEVSQ